MRMYQTWKLKKAPNFFYVLCKTHSIDQAFIDSMKNLPTKKNKEAQKAEQLKQLLLGDAESWGAACKAGQTWQRRGRSHCWGGHATWISTLMWTYLVDFVLYGRFAEKLLKHGELERQKFRQKPQILQMRAIFLPAELWYCRHLKGDHDPKYLIGLNHSFIFVTCPRPPCLVGSTHLLHISRQQVPTAWAHHQRPKSFAPAPMWSTPSRHPEPLSPYTRGRLLFRFHLLTWPWRVRYQLGK